WKPEKKLLVPFIGPSGMLLRRLIKSVGIDFNKCYFTNVLKEHPPGDNFRKFVHNNPNTYVNHVEMLKLELNSLKNLRLIVPIGNEASWIIAMRKQITLYNGSILKTTDEFLCKKCIPIVHPASILKSGNWKLKPITVEYLKRIKKESQFTGVHLLKRNFTLKPSYEEVMDFFSKIRHSDKHVSFDIETVSKTNYTIETFQLSNDKNNAISVPLICNGHNFYSLSEEVEIWKGLKDILYSKRIIGANLTCFDVYLLSWHGIDPIKVLKNLYMDIGDAHQLLEPDLSRGVAFIVSIYTREPYFKNERARDIKDHGYEEANKRFWTYGCKDAAVVSEIAPKLEQDLKDARLWDFYQNHVNKLAVPRMRMMQRGLLRDKEKIKRLETELLKEIFIKQAELNVLAGRVINVRSVPGTQQFLYSDLKLPVVKRRNKISTDEDAIRELYAKYPENKALKLFIEIRNARTELSNNIYVKEDVDGKERTSYGFTKTGRFTSSKTLMNTGRNQQNIPRKMRGIYIPTPGYRFLESDGSQIEARIVVYKSRDLVAIRDFETGVDRHTKTAVNLYNKPKDQITYNERYLAKKVNHASNYGLQFVLFWIVYNADALEQGLPTITIDQARIFLSKHHQANPRIKGVYQREIREELLRTHAVMNGFGRRIKFHDRIGARLYQQAYAAYGQSTAVDYVNKILIDIDGDIVVVQQGHDSLLLEVPIGHEREYVNRMQKAISVPELVVEKRRVPIPFDFSIGENWGDMKEFDPDKDGEMEEIIERM
ncbi:MAG: DNA polymerase, partial [Thermodesulfobacteriota bacterium]